MLVLLRGRPVWIGQISRDVGLTFSWKTFIGHEADPDVDEARNYLAQDMVRSQGVEPLGWAKGVGAASEDEPHHMADGSPFFTERPAARPVVYEGTDPARRD